jgi:hypothetical protein
MIKINIYPICLPVKHSLLDFMNENGLYAFIYILFGFYLHQSVFHHYNTCTDTWFYGLSALNMNRVIACPWIIRDSHCILVFCQHVGNYSVSNISGVKMMKMSTYSVYRQKQRVPFNCRLSNVSHPIFNMRTTHNVDPTAVVNVEQQYKRSSFTLCLSGMFVILSCSFTSIFFLTNNSII